MQTTSNDKTAKRKKKTGLDPKKKMWVIAGALVFTLFGLVVPFSAMQMENHNSFCASCHTQDEAKFVDRSTAQDAVDLASIHNIKEQARCVDCHTGPGIVGRYGGLFAGATDLISYFSGHFPQPAALEEPYPDKNCLKCHGDISTKKEFNNHFHAFLPQWRALDSANAARCVDCHASHDTTNDAGVSFINKTATVKVCQKCHAMAGGG